MITISLERLEETAVMGRALIRRLPGAGLLVIDADLMIRIVDGDAFREWELANGVLQDRRLEDVLPPAVWSRLEPQYRAALAGTVQTFEFESANGAVHAVRLAPIVDADAVVGVLALAHDVTAETRAVKRLADGEGLQRSVLEVLDEGVLVVGTDGRLMQANRAACSILRLDLASALADPEWWAKLGARHRGGAATLNVGARVIETGLGVRGVDVEVTLPGGVGAVLSVNYQPLRDHEPGPITGLVLSFRDVTERVLEHARLVESRERLREAHEVAGLASWEWRPATDRVRVLHGLGVDGAAPGKESDLEDLLGQLPVEDRRLVRDDLAALLSGERDETTRRLCHDYPHGPLWLETRSRAIRDADGGLLCVRGTTQDVTDEEVARRQASDERDFFQATLDSLSAHIAVLSETGEIVMTNRAWHDFGAANDAAPGAIVGNYLGACDAAGADAWAARAAAGLRDVLTRVATEFTMEYPCHAPDRDRWFTLRAVRFAGEGEARVVVAHEDVTERHSAVDRAATQGALLDEVDAAVIATDVAGSVTHWNRGAERLYGWTAVETVGRPLDRLTVGPTDPALARAIAQAVFDDGRWQGRFEVSRKDGTHFPAYVRDALITDDAGHATGKVGVSIDVTARVAAERALVAARDYMRAVADSMGDGLFTLDTEGRLIYMNDAAAGLLGWSLDELEGCVLHDVVHARRADGSHQAIEDSPIARAGREGRRVRVEDDVFIRRDGHALPVAYTAAPFETTDGVAGCVVVFADVSERNAQAEQLVREAETFKWIGRLREAMADDRFVLHAQPIVDLQTRETMQRELLLRLREPGGAIVGPGAFLDIAEQHGLIVEIDCWVIGRALEIAGQGHAVEINLSGRSMGDRVVLEHIEHHLALSGADPARVVFEITETAIVKDAEAARVFAERLRDLGCKLALDDFGTGYGGFTYLKQIPVDYLKIDIEFVRDLLTNPGSRHVVEAVVALARGFGLQTVAEGIEDAGTFDLLAQLGVDFGQGYHIARPGPLDDLREPP